MMLTACFLLHSLSKCRSGEFSWGNKISRRIFPDFHRCALSPLLPSPATSSVRPLAPTPAEARELSNIVLRLAMPSDQKKPAADVPADLGKTLRACIRCKLLKTFDQARSSAAFSVCGSRRPLQFYDRGCENCEGRLGMAGERASVERYTTANFNGRAAGSWRRAGLLLQKVADALLAHASLTLSRTISVFDPSASWAAKWLRLGAVGLSGSRLPTDDSRVQRNRCQAATRYLSPTRWSTREARTRQGACVRPDEDGRVVFTRFCWWGMGSACTCPRQRVAYERRTTLANLSFGNDVRQRFSTHRRGHSPFPLVSSLVPLALLSLGACATCRSHRLPAPLVRPSPPVACRPAPGALCAGRAAPPPRL